MDSGVARPPARLPSAERLLQSASSRLPESEGRKRIGSKRMCEKASGMASSKLVAMLALAAVATSGLTGCKLDSDKDGFNLIRDGGTSGGPPPPSGSTANKAPTITGAPVTTAKISLPYSFQPVARDADGDRLTFKIQGQPSWATFSTSTGRLEGTPPTGSNGTFTGIQITVSDGDLSTAMAPFSISVVDPVVGSAELAWQPPTENEDGTPLADLSGYVIRYGKSAGALEQSVRITNPGTTMYLVENLIEGTWYFSLSSVNASGVESRPTGYVSKTIS
jgi:hypothetical protein